MSSIVSSTSDLPIKYQRLASEYAKLRAQVPVLKSAVLDERKLTGDLNEKLRDEDQKIRKLESELESVGFRNDQLTKRVEFLQEKLQEATNPALKKKAALKIAKSQKNHINHASSCDNILEEELDRKLRENTDLHSKIFELEATHERELQGVMEKMSELEKENHNLNQDMKSIKCENTICIAEICKEKDKLFDRINHLESELRSSTQSIPRSESEAQRVEHTPKVHASLISKPFEVLSIDERKDIFEEMKRLVEQLLTGFSVICSGYHQRVQYYPKDTTMEHISETQDELSHILLHSNELLETLTFSANQFLSDCVAIDFKDARSSASQCSLSGSSFTEYWDTNVMPAFIKGLGEEEHVTWCSRDLTKANTLWKDSFVDMNSSLQYTRATMVQLNWRIMQPQDIMNNITEMIEKLSRSAAELSANFDGKVVAEHGTPAVSARLRGVNECLSASFRSFYKNLRFFRNILSVRKDGLVRFIAMLKNEATGISAGQIPPERETVDSLLNEVQSISQETEGGILKQEMEMNRWKVCELEKEKDRLKVELQFLKVKQNLNGNLLHVDPVTLESFYQSRVQNLVEELQIVSGKCMYLQAECLSLASLVKEKHTNCNQLKMDLQDSMQKISQLNEELDTTRQNYELQMSSLTEHMAQMDQTILEKTEQLNIARQNSSKSNGSTKRKFF